jgi:hypothetical protein
LRVGPVASFDEADAVALHQHHRAAARSVARIAHEWRCAGSGIRWLEGVVTFQGRVDNLALREAAMVALGFNVLMVAVAIPSILLTIPAGKRGE